MASYLELKIGTKISTHNASDTKADNVLSDVVTLFEITGTDQQKVDGVLALLVEKIEEWSRQQREPGAIDTAVSDVEDDTDFKFTL